MVFLRSPRDTDTITKRANRSWDDVDDGVSLWGGMLRVSEDILDLTIVFFVQCVVVTVMKVGWSLE
jgi:hypothetical protein